MKKNIVWILVSCLLAVLAFCGIACADETGAVIDLYGSEMYTQEDLETAVDVILTEFESWEGCELHSLVYAGDEESMDRLDYANEFDKGPFDEVVLFDSAFRSPKEAYGAWEADTEYTWSWTLARADKGDWQLLTWGYKENWMKSEQYTEDDLSAAVDVIYAEFEKMEGTAVHYMKYAGDEFSSSQLEYVNSLDRGEFDECAVFYVWFQSPKEAYGAWEADLLYNWSFFLARADKGEWQVVTFGN